MMTQFFALLMLIICLAYQAPAHSQSLNEQPPFRRCFVGTSAFMTFNLFVDPAPDFAQLNFGYWLTKKDVLSVEAITWKYHAPLGIPLGQEQSADEEQYNGHVQEFGLGLAYQRYWYRGLYTALHATPLSRRFRNENNEEVGRGFQLFCTLRVGYHIPMLNNRLFVEPSIALTFWPVSTGAPDAFQQLDDKWPSYFAPEPGLHIGYKF